MTYSELTLRFDVIPTPHQSFRMGRNGISYTPKKVLDFKKDIAWELSTQLPNDFEISTIETGFSRAPYMVHSHYGQKFRDLKIRRQNFPVFKTT